MNGYAVSFGPNDGVRIATNGEINFLRFPGVYTITLEDLAENCIVAEGVTRQVTSVANEVVNVSFAVSCELTGIELSVQPSGVDLPATYHVLINGQHAGTGAMGGALLISRLSPGTHNLTLSISDHCAVESGQPVTVTVVNRSVTPVGVNVICVPIVRSEKIAYVAAGSGYDTWLELIRPDGSGQERVVKGQSPSWAPDGRRLVFSNVVCDYYGCGGGGLAILDPETRLVTVLNSGADGLSPAWSPAGDVIAFVRTGVQQGVFFSRLYLVGLDGSAAVIVNIGDGVRASDPAWSPDGRHIAFTCTTGQGALANPFNHDVCVVAADGSGLRWLTEHTAFDGMPAWSQDGSRIAFATSRFGPATSVALMDADGNGVTRVAEGNGPAWSRDGRKLVFTGSNGLFTVNLDGSGLTRLSTGAHWDASWRP